MRYLNSFEHLLLQPNPLSQSIKYFNLNIYTGNKFYSIKITKQKYAFKRNCNVIA